MKRPGTSEVHGKLTGYQAQDQRQLDLGICTY